MSRELTYATVCSGIECMSVACIGLPLRPVFFSEIEPFPCAVLRSHYPDVPNLGDMSKIQVSDEGLNITNGRESIALDKPLDILAGGTPCFAAGTMVLTPKGYVPIETLKVGDEVVSGTGHVRKVEAVGSKMAAVGRLKVLGRPEIICTPNHPFFCVGMKRDNRRKSETYAQKIPVGDYAVSRADEAVGKYVGRINHGRMTAYSIGYPKCGEATCDDIMELAGWYLGDGYIRRFKGKTKKSVVFALCCEKKIVRFKERFGGIVNVYDNGEGKLIVNCTALADWLVANFGEHAAEKRIPFWCYDRENTHCLLRGYEATDGCHSNNERKFCTVSPALAYGVADLIGNASISLYVPPPKGRIQGREINQKPCYVVAVPVGRTIRTKYINGRYASIVRSYNGTDGLVRVYNITVAEEHDYIVSGLWTHNCQDVSVAGKRAGMQEGSGTRSSLAFDFVRLARELRPRWVLWENVAGSIDSKNAADFLRFASALGDCGYSLAWRVLDAQYVRVDGMERAVPQRRRRVWVVGCLGADESVPAQILFEPDCAQGHTPPRRRAGQGFTYSLARRDRVDAQMVGEPATRVCSCSAKQQSLAADEQLEEVSATLSADDITQSGQGYVNNSVVQIADGVTLDAKNGFPVADGVSQSLIGGTAPGHKNAVVSTNSNGEDVAATLTRDLAKQTGAQQQAGGGMNPFDEELGETQSVCHQGGVVQVQSHGINWNTGDIVSHPPTEEASQTMRSAPLGEGGAIQTIGFKAGQSKDGGLGDEREVSPTLSHKPSALEPTLAQSGDLSQMCYIVRRLTPTEAERLMGLPDGYTIPMRLAPTPTLVADFQRIFDTFGAIMAEYEHKPAPKPKSANQVRAWLDKITNPATCPDSPRYKACGNGWATNQPRWILTRLLAIGEGIDPFEESNTSSGGCREAGASKSTLRDNVPTVGAPANFCEGGAA